MTNASVSHNPEIDMRDSRVVQSSSKASRSERRISSNGHQKPSDLNVSIRFQPYCIFHSTYTQIFECAEKIQIFYETLESNPRTVGWLLRRTGRARPSPRRTKQHIEKRKRKAYPRRGRCCELILNRSAFFLLAYHSAAHFAKLYHMEKCYHKITRIPPVVRVPKFGNCCNRSIQM